MAEIGVLSLWLARIGCLHATAGHLWTKFYQPTKLSSWLARYLYIHPNRLLALLVTISRVFLTDPLLQFQVLITRSGSLQLFLVRHLWNTRIRVGLVLIISSKILQKLFEMCGVRIYSLYNSHTLNTC